MERRRKLLFPTKEANSNYRRIREKLIGVTLKYEPNISLIISEILKSSKYDSSIKDMLEKKKEAFSSEMQNRNHKNIRTFQFFLSKVSYLLEKLSDINTDPEYLDIIKEHIISETFYQAIKFKSNDQPSRTMHAQLKKEQEAKFQSIKQYIESGTYNQKIFEDNVLNLQKELQAQIPDDDPYYLIYQQYYLQPQDWCEDQLEKVLQRLDENKYPIAFYVKIITSIQRLIDLGFDDEYMNRTKQLMLTNITKMNEVKLIDSDLWYIENKQTKAKVTEVITDINHAIKEHSEIVSRENVGDILKSDNWINRLENYSNPNQNRYVQDMSVFSKAPPEQWLNLLHKASPTIKPNVELVYNKRIKKEEFIQAASSAYQQIMDLIARFQTIDAAIINSNANTKITTSYGTYTVAAAISLRSRMRNMGAYDNEANFENRLRNKLMQEYSSRVCVCDKENAKLKETADSMRLSILGKDTKVKEDKPLAVVDAYIKENTTELVDPLSVEKLTAKLDEKHDKLLSELDTQIKVSNATTFIEF